MISLENWNYKIRLLFVLILSGCASLSPSKDVNPSLADSSAQEIKTFPLEVTDPASTLKNAWKALHRKDFEAAKLSADDILKLTLGSRTEEAVAHYILGMVFKQEDLLDQARSEFQRVVDDYPTVYYPPERNYLFYRNITERSQDHLDLMDTPYDFGNYTSATFMTKAWESWDAKDWEGVKLYALKCIKLYGDIAKQMQKDMKDFSPPGFIPYFWAVNDVGTCHFILGLAYLELNETQKAKEMFEAVINDYGYAMCWNPNGFYWKVAEGSQKELDKLNEGRVQF